MAKFLVFMLTLFSLVSINAKEKEIVLTDDNTVSLRTAFTAESVGNLIQEIEKLNTKLPSDYPIYLFLYTPGGSIQAGLEFYEYVKGLNRPIHTITLFAASMGFQTVQQLGKRYILKNGVLMSHPAAAGGIGGSFPQITSRFGLWLRRVAELDQDTVNRTNGKYTLKTYTDAYQQELWLTGEEAVKQGFADEVVSVKCDASLYSQTETIAVDGAFATVDVQFNKCPLRTAPTSVTANVVTNVGKMKLVDFLAKNPDFKTCDQLTYLNKEPVCSISPELNINIVNKEIEKQANLFKTDIKDRIQKY